MKCNNCDNPATMHKHYEKSDDTFAERNYRESEMG